jgi:hypothetical protein
MSPRGLGIAALVALGCGGSQEGPAALDAAMPGARDAEGVSGDLGPDRVPGAGGDAGEAADAAPRSCDELPAGKFELLLAGAFSCAWMEPALARPPDDDFTFDLLGVLSVGVTNPTTGALLDGCTVSGGQTFAVQEPGGRRLTVVYDVEFGLTNQPLAPVLAALAGKTVALRYLAKKRANWATGFAARDGEGLAFAFDTGLHGHVLAKDDLDGLGVTLGPIACITKMGCARAFSQLSVAADQPVAVPPAEESLVMWRGRAYDIYNIRHHHDTSGPQCPDAFDWMAWSLARR